ncbi:nucleotide kinase domain-containing protein [Psychrobacter jeotgali]|uniref:nucleotide kinase domain-containing protein n=1 Tax=Psychrobacter jeotgali TaxID=179010 RepID=UPI001918B076|nr:nucleotide kinase domain-containing protein [Psychrobacter jeotgali]
MIKPNEEVFKYYFYFIQERMNIFWNKYEDNYPLTQDPTLQSYKFTNVYRAMDRVSQYLIKNVIYSDDNFSDKDVLLRIIVFKIFNKPETWEYLESEFGKISLENFNLRDINNALLKRKESGPIFNNAYMMTGTHSLYNHLDFKHEKWLQMVKDELIGQSVFDKIIDAKSLSDTFNYLRCCSFIGDFLAYQYAIDMNYSDVINFSEDSFVKAGIGAIRGIKKCFGNTSSSKYSNEDIIKFTQDNFEYYQSQFGYNDFTTLFGRSPTLIDLQNCFCETDKLLRVKMPDLQVQNKRIKQQYKETPKPLELFFPPKWHINHKIDKPSMPATKKHPTLF